MRYKILSVFFMLFFVAGTAMAQKKGGAGKGKMTPEQKAQKHTDKMAEVMGLSSDVKSKVLAVNTTRAKAMEPINKSIDAKYPDKAVRKASKAAIKTEFGPQRKAIQAMHKTAIKAAGVTDEQWNKWRAYVKSERGKKNEDMDDEDDDDN